MTFVELKCKSNFSFLRGASDAREYIVQAALLEMPAVAITDVNGVYGLPRAFEAMRQRAPHMKLISGAEITFKDHPPLTLLAQTRKAYGLLCRIITQVHADKEKGEGFLTLAELSHFMTTHAGAPELVCLPDLSEKTNLDFLSTLFKKNLFLPLCRYLDGLDQKRTDFILARAQKYNLKVFATNDVHYHELRRRPLQDCLTCIREGVTIDKAGLHLFGNDERYLKSDAQMRALFADYPEAIDNAVAIAASCTFSLSELKYTYPHEFIPPGHTAQSYLRQLVFAGAEKTYKGNVPDDARAQIETELAFFAKRGDEHYFLTVHDIVRFANQKNILCQGRGSAANSIVCYVLGITSVDPISMNLLFDRFMNDGREEPPDIDIDFEHERREEVIQYIYERFGRHRAAMVAAVRTYRRKSAFLELSKAVGVEVGTITASELEIRFDELSKDLKYRRPQIDAMVQDLKGFPRHISIHSGGFVLSDDDLIEIVPIEPARMPGRTIVQWDKDDLETLGLMKIDVLSIGFLTALHRATDLAGLNWRDIPPDDGPTYKMIQRAETLGTFQIESRAQINMLVQTLPRNYYDLVVEVALVRPSPSKGGMVQPYLRGLRNARNGKPFKIGNAALEKVLGRTYGVPIFQEQIMQISIDVAGFTPSEADQLRRSLGLQRSAHSINEMAQKLYHALVSQNIPKKFADDLFLYIQGYAHYGFPESHAASYASLAYKSAYMKCHHPAELLLGLMNSQPMGFYPIDILINEAKRNGVNFLPVDPNISDWHGTLEAPRTIRMGFQNVKSIRKTEVDQMIWAREESPFRSIEDFIARTSFSKDVLENLSLINAFEAFGLDRRHSFWKSVEFSRLNENQPGTKRSRGRTRETSAGWVDQVRQLSLFDEHSRLENTPDLFSKMSLLEEISTDYRKTGYSLEGNLMKGLREEVQGLPKTNSVQIKKLPRDRVVIYAGILSVIQRPPPANGTAFITLEDEFGSMDTVLKNEVFEKYEEVIRSSRFLVVRGKLQKKGTGSTILVDAVKSFAAAPAKRYVSPQGSPRAGGKLDWT